ncbi:MAG: hypothetical protein HY929_04855 [Euryarchaeota archaeon]|nr:hypothetical protein [Euryarchaeota archaeon]
MEVDLTEKERTLKQELSQLTAAILILAFHSDPKCTDITGIMDEFGRILKYLEQMKVS